MNVRICKKEELDFNNLLLKNNEVICNEFLENTELYWFSKDLRVLGISGKPVKCIKIGNGSQLYHELKSIVILDNSDFIICDKDWNIIDYVTNSSPIEAVKGVE